MPVEPATAATAGKNSLKKDRRADASVLEAGRKGDASGAVAVATRERPAKTTIGAAGTPVKKKKRRKEQQTAAADREAAPREGSGGYSDGSGGAGVAAAAAEPPMKRDSNLRAAAGSAAASDSPAAQTDGSNAGDSPVAVRSCQRSCASGCPSLTTPC